MSQGLLSVARTALSIRFNESIKGLPRATMLSSISLISRFGMIGSLAFLSGVTKAANPQNVQTLFLIFGVVAFLFAATAFLAICASRRSSARKAEMYSANEVREPALNTILLGDAK